MSRTLVADIGGTNSRFAILGKSPADLIDVTVFKNDLFESFESVFARAVAEISGDFTRVVIAVAGPLDDRGATLTNRGWPIHPARLQPLLPGAKVEVINDFVAQAEALPYLGSSGLHTVTPQTNIQPGHKLVVGAGTGLGVGFLIDTPQGWLAVPGEGGHVTLPIKTPREFEIRHALSAHLPRVSAERFLSGPGLLTLCRTICNLAGAQCPATNPEDVLCAARRGDANASEAIAVFVTLLGRVTGDLALAMIPKGGIYLGGGAAKPVIDHVGTDVFVTEVRAKGRVSKAICDIPIHIITDPYVGLIGVSAAALRQR